MMILYSLLLFFFTFNTLECQKRNIGIAGPLQSDKPNLFNGIPYSINRFSKVRLLNKPGIHDHGTEHFPKRFVSDWIWDFRISVPRFIRLKRGIDFGLNRGYSGSKVMWKLWLNNLVPKEILVAKVKSPISQSPNPNPNHMGFNHPG